MPLPESNAGGERYREPTQGDRPHTQKQKITETLLHKVVSATIIEKLQAAGEKGDGRGGRNGEESNEDEGRLVTDGPAGTHCHAVCGVRRAAWPRVVWTRRYRRKNSVCFRSGTMPIGIFGHGERDESITLSLRRTAAMDLNGDFKLGI
ncbi:hypothetical protein H4582DRAFT_2059013 [Lactarius indigo]|nr:hypothetical protein H4582DRAFT_2059013 [Lactarius indigo]